MKKILALRRKIFPIHIPHVDGRRSRRFGRRCQTRKSVLSGRKNRHSASMRRAQIHTATGEKSSHRDDEFVDHHTVSAGGSRGPVVSGPQSRAGVTKSTMSTAKNFEIAKPLGTNKSEKINPDRFSRKVLAGTIMHSFSRRWDVKKTNACRPIDGRKKRREKVKKREHPSICNTTLPHVCVLKSWALVWLESSLRKNRVGPLVEIQARFCWFGWSKELFGSKWARALRQ